MEILTGNYKKVLCFSSNIIFTLLYLFYYNSYINSIVNIIFIIKLFCRSPWSNTYDPPLEDGSMPSERLRKLEIDANHAFDQYRELYFEGGVSSVYLWDLDHGFAAVILIKKAGDGSKKIKGCWDSIHVVEVQEKSSGRIAHYKLTSTAMLWLQTNKHGSGTMNLGGSLTRQVCEYFL